jgi:hypothetical protein
MQKNIKTYPDKDVAYIDDLWNRIGQKIKSNGIKSSFIKRAIKEARSVKN